ncbi:pteridine reductase [Moraxella sp.]|uniref:pteridine reductase n=1 Tax=Moraxella sp. TaxID=479 RepID=UPI0026DD9497|nr:pteridine reductase [Moraxella sp.]MDO4894055.1 pteridine reductase [Moraxella sp.]
MTNKVALITGGAKRIGASISQSLHANGFDVIIHHSTSIQHAHALVDEFNAIRPNSAKCVQADLGIVNDSLTLQQFYQQVMDCFGRLDVLVHNASSFYATPLDGSVERLHQQWDDLFLTNAKAPFFISQVFLNELKNNNGQIISILDIHADNKPFIGYPIYTMAKTAHRMMVQSLALELAPKVRINGVSPGVNIFPDDNSNAQLNDDTKALLTDSIPLACIGTPNDIANAVLFFVQASYITGQVLAVDGGRSLTLKGG